MMPTRVVAARLIAVDAIRANQLHVGIVRVDAEVDVLAVVGHEHFGLFRGRSAVEGRCWTNSVIFNAVCHTASSDSHRRAEAAPNALRQRSDVPRARLSERPRRRPQGQGSSLDPASRGSGRLLTGWFAQQPARRRATRHRETVKSRRIAPSNAAPA